MKTALWLVGGGLSLVLAGCSSSDAVAPGGGGGDAATGTGGKGGGNGSGGSNTGGSGTGGHKADAAAAVEIRGQVVDASSSTGFDATKYAPVSGVDVCVYEDSSVPCVKTNSTGDYDLLGAPTNKAIFLSYKKTGFNSTLYAVTTTTPGLIDAPPIIMGTPVVTGAFATQAGITVDSTKGTVLFGAVTPGTKADSPFFEMFGTAGFIYVKGYQVVPGAAVAHGPFYVGEDWKVDKTLQESSAAGWGFVTADPGSLTLTFSHPALKCGTATTRVVAGFDTTYVGVICSVPTDGGADGAAPTPDGSAPKDAASGG